VAFGFVEIAIGIALCMTVLRDRLSSCFDFDCDPDFDYLAKTGIIKTRD